jgi:hypothetical protein
MMEWGQFVSEGTADTHIGRCEVNESFCVASITVGWPFVGPRASLCLEE